MYVKKAETLVKDECYNNLKALKLWRKILFRITRFSSQLWNIQYCQWHWKILLKMLQSLPWSQRPQKPWSQLTCDFTFLRLQICSFDWSDWLSVMVFEPLMMLAGTFSQNFSQRKKYHWYHAFEVMFLGYLNLLFKIWSFWLGVLSEMLKFLDDKRFWWRKNINSYGKIGMLNYYIVVVLKVTSDNTSVFKVAECYFKICYSKPSYQNWLPNYCAKPDDKCDCSDRCSRYS